MEAQVQMEMPLDNSTFQVIKMTYSYDLRKKSLEYLEKGGTKKEAREIVSVTERTLLNR